MLPGWLFQSTDFYSFATGPTSPGPIPSWIVPLIVVAVTIPVLRRYPTAWLVVPAVLVVIVSAHHQVASVSNSCSYCEDRSLLPMGVLVAFVIGAGVAAPRAESSGGCLGGARRNERVRRHLCLQRAELVLRRHVFHPHGTSSGRRSRPCERGHR